MLGVSAVLVALVGTAMSQYQSFYAGGGWAYPGPLPQFAAGNAEEGLADRLGQVTTTTTTSTTQSPEQFIASWPEDRQPFWFVNRQQIEEHLGRPQPQGFPQGQGSRLPQNQPDSQTQGLDTQRQPQNQPQPQDLPNTRSQAPGTQSELLERGSQVQDNQPQAQNPVDADRQYQLWLQNQFFARRNQQWWPRNQPDTQALDNEESPRWRGRPGTKTIFRRQ